MQSNNTGAEKESVPTEIFRADLTKLHPGDVLLTRNVHSDNFRDRATSATIRAATGGEFSHALICTSAPTFIEAVGDFVSNISIQNCFAHDIENIRLLRHTDKNIAGEASKSALLFLGMPYSVKKAMKSIIPGLNTNVIDEEGVFCSALVAAAYTSAKCPEFLKMNPMSVTPQTLEKAHWFTDVTKKVFSQIITPPNWQKMSALDGDRVSNPVMEQQGRLFGEYYNEISPLCTKLKEDFPGYINGLPKSFFEVIEFLANGLKKFELEISSAMKNQPVIDLINRIHEIDNKAFKLLSDGRLDSMMSAAMKLDDNSLIRINSESFIPNPDLDIDDLLGMAQSTDKQISDRSSYLKSYASYPNGVCLTLDKWLENTQNIVDAFSRRKQLLSEVLERLLKI